MSKAKKHDPFADMVDEMEPEADESAQPEGAEVEASAGADAAEEASGPTQEAPAEDAPGESESDEVQAASGEAESDEDEGGKPGVESQADLEATLAAERERAESLHKEVMRLRAKARLSEVQAMDHRAPNPAQPATSATPPPAAPSSTGIIWEDGIAKVDPAFIAAQIEERMRPDPRTQAREREETLRRSFIGTDEGSRERATTFSRADEAMDLFNLKMWDFAQTSGADLSRLGVEGILATARDVGILGEIETHYPDVAPHVADFLVAGTLPPGHGDIAMRNTLDRYHRSRVQEQTAPEPRVPTKPAAIPNTAKVQVQTDRPPSTATKGTPPTGDNASSKKQREVFLTDKLAADPMFGLTAAEERELQDLRSDLGL